MLMTVNRLSVVNNGSTNNTSLRVIVYIPYFIAKKTVERKTFKGEIFTNFAVLEPPAKVFPQNLGVPYTYLL